MDRIQFAKPWELSEAACREIADFLDSQDTSHPFQLPQWSAAESGSSAGNARFVIFRRDGEIRWFASCSITYPYGRLLAAVRSLTIDCGPVCDDPQTWNSALDALRKAGIEHGLASVQMTPEIVQSSRLDLAPLLREFEGKPCGSTRLSLRLDLSRNEDTLLGGFRKTTRYEIRRAERIGIRVTPFVDRTEIAEFLRIYSRMLQRKRFSSDPEERLLRVLQWLLREPCRGTLLVARHEGKILGGAILVRTGSRCWYVWGATERYPYSSVGYPLQWHALLWAKAHGCLEYDFGGFRKNAISGPALFKRGFRGAVVQFLDAYALPVSTERMWLMRQLQSYSSFRRSLHPLFSRQLEKSA